MSRDSDRVEMVETGGGGKDLGIGEGFDEGWEGCRGIR